MSVLPEAWHLLECGTIYILGERLPVLVHKATLYSEAVLSFPRDDSHCPAWEGTGRPRHHRLALPAFNLVLVIEQCWKSRM